MDNETIVRGRTRPAPSASDNTQALEKARKGLDRHEARIETLEARLDDLEARLEGLELVLDVETSADPARRPA